MKTDDQIAAELAGELGLHEVKTLAGVYWYNSDSYAVVRNVHAALIRERREKEQAEAERDRALERVGELETRLERVTVAYAKISEGECLPACNSLGHADNCPYAWPDEVIRQALQKTESR